MALRIKNHWHDDDQQRSLEEIAGALAFISWRVAKDKAINLHGEDFIYETDQQRMDVIVEYLIFQLQIVDRIAHDRMEMPDQERQQLVITLAKHLAGHLHDNCTDIMGPGDYVNPFIAKLNQRSSEYAEFSYGNDGPSYPFMRHLGYEIQQVMGETQANRWVIDQVMDKDGLDVHREISRSMDNLFE